MIKIQAKVTPKSSSKNADTCSSTREAKIDPKGGTFPCLNTLLWNYPQKYFLLFLGLSDLSADQPIILKKCIPWAGGRVEGAACLSTSPSWQLTIQ